MNRFARRLITVGVLLSLVALGLWLGLRTASSPRLVAGLLERLLDRPVAIAEVRLGLGKELELELRELAIFEPTPPDTPEEDPGTPALAVPRAVGSLSWRQLLDGTWTPLQWKLQAPVWRLRNAEAGSGFELPPLPLEVAVEDGTLEWYPEGKPPLRFEGLELQARHSALEQSLRGSARGELDQQGSRASFAVEFEASARNWSVVGEVESLELAQLAAYVSSGTRPTGHVAGDFTFAYEAGVWEGSIDLGIDTFRLQLPNFSGPIAPTETRVALTARMEGDATEIRAKRVQLDDFIVSGDLTVSEGPARRIRGALQFADFRPGEPGDRLQFNQRFLRI